MAVIESHLVDKIHFLESPGIPWNFDVALVYIGIGFFYTLGSDPNVVNLSPEC